VPLPALLVKACSASLAEIVALLTSVPGCVVCKVTLIEAAPPLIRVPSEHTVAPPMFAQLPCEDVADTKVAPAGTGLVIVTPVAAAGPMFVASIVKVTLPLLPPGWARRRSPRTPGQWSFCPRSKQARAWSRSSSNTGKVAEKPEVLS